MNRNFTVSVWMIAYNHEAFISQAIEGVLMQKTDFPVELVIGEDFSTDRTRAICLEYQKKYPEKIRLLERETNLGMTRNLVDTLENCQGKYVALCEGDDYWTDPLKLQKQIDFLEADPNFAICFHRVEVKYEDGSRETELSNPGIDDVTTFDDLARGNYIHTPSCVFRNGLFNGFPDFFSGACVGDWVLHLLNAEHGKIKFLDDTMAVYRVHKGGVWGMKPAEDAMREMAELVEDLLRHFYPKGEKNFRHLGGYLFSELCYLSFEKGSYREARAYGRKAFLLADSFTFRRKLALGIRFILGYTPPLADYYKSAARKRSKK